MIMNQHSYLLQLISGEIERQKRESLLFVAQIFYSAMFQLLRMPGIRRHIDMRRRKTIQLLFFP